MQTDGLSEEIAAVMKRLNVGRNEPGGSWGAWWFENVSVALVAELHVGVAN